MREEPQGTVVNNRKSVGTRESPVIMSVYRTPQTGGKTHPRREVGLRFKVFPKVLVAFEVAQVCLQGKRRQEEVGLLSLDALREQQLFPQVPVVVVPGNSVTTEKTEIAIRPGIWSAVSH